MSEDSTRSEHVCLQFAVHPHKCDFRAGYNTLPNALLPPIARRAQPPFDGRAKRVRDLQAAPAVITCQPRTRASGRCTLLDGDPGRQPRPLRLCANESPATRHIGQPRRARHREIPLPCPTTVAESESAALWLACDAAHSPVRQPRRLRPRAVRLLRFRQDSPRLNFRATGRGTTDTRSTRKARAGGRAGERPKRPSDRATDRHGREIQPRPRAACECTGYRAVWDVAGRR